ncbi:MAG: hypothetical protein HUU37_10020, partial [Bdellovibrionales bacterium]|nr:hypothetical protein [Bdellovibrionales bacterium]
MIHEELKDFFSSELAERAASGIGSRAEVELVSGGAHYTFTRVKSGNRIKKQRARN